MPMNKVKPVAIAVTVLFGIYSAIALASDGIGGTIDAITFNLMAGQIYIDLVLAALALAVVMYRDAQRIGRNPWPFIVLTAIAGMFGPLIYLVTRPNEPDLAI